MALPPHPSPAEKQTPRPPDPKETPPGEPRVPVVPIKEPNNEPDNENDDGTPRPPIQDPGH